MVSERLEGGLRRPGRAIAVHASAGNTFQLPQIEFGPDAGASRLLRPETQRSYSVGAKASALQGRLDFDSSAFLAHRANQPVAVDAAGSPMLVAAGTQRYKGAELETTYRVTPALSVSAQAS